jgi:hypothetical protein
VRPVEARCFEWRDTLALVVAAVLSWSLYVGKEPATFAICMAGAS